jgi:hypothetical protein
MSTALAGVISSPPNVLIQPVLKDHEQAKYEKCWETPGYRDVAPGEGAVQIFRQLTGVSKGDTVIDFGAGTGRGALMLALFSGCKVQMLDFAENCLDDDVRQMLTTQPHALSFAKQDLRKEIAHYAKYGFCTDVMEHIPTEDVKTVLIRILKSAQYVFFQISNLPDHFGEVVGETLHLTVKPFEWWEQTLKECDATIMWSQDLDGTSGFYVTGWTDTKEFLKQGVVNTDAETIRANVRHSLTLGLTDLMAYEKNDIPVMILAGGPSLNDFKDEIIARRNAGEKLITVNGAYNWCIENGITPSAQVMVDAREFNKRFVEPVKPNVHYFLGSQCHAETFKAVPKDQTILWHSALDEELVPELEQFYKNKGTVWYPVIGGSNVTLRTLPLMFILGYRKFEIFGWDSCLIDGAHHAYEQKENDKDCVVRVICNNRTFACNPWMASAAQEFLDMMQILTKDDDFAINVRGDGLIAWLIQTASEQGDVEVEVLDT